MEVSKVNGHRIDHRGPAHYHHGELVRCPKQGHYMQQGKGSSSAADIKDRAHQYIFKHQNRVIGVPTT